MKQLKTVEEYLKESGAESLEPIRGALKHYQDGTAVVIFRNQMMDSSAFGDSSSVVVGPSNTFKSVEECEGKWLKDLPSQRQHAYAWISREVLESTNE